MLVCDPGRLPLPVLVQAGTRAASDLHLPGRSYEVIFTPIAQGPTRVATLISGELDLVYPVPV